MDFEKKNNEGNESKTKIGIMYMNNIVDKDL